MKRFHNQYVRSRTRFGSILKMLFRVVDEPFVLYQLNGEHYNPLILSVDYEKIYDPDPDKIQLTWVGHTTFLLQLNGVNILTDPHFSKRASPVQWFGPPRLVEPPLPFNKLPKIDAVLLSHDHYDHLDLNTVKALGNDVRFIVPLALRRWFERIGITNVIEKNWWESLNEFGMTFTSVPVQHFSGRVPLFFNTTLWSGWVIENGSQKVYFGGDTGYCPHFKEVREKFGDMDLSLIPIGAYHPRWFMKNVHVDPREAVQVHKDLGSKQSVAMHWGTFRLTYEPTMEPPTYLRNVMEEEGVPEEAFKVLSFGETFTIP